MNNKIIKKSILLILFAIAIVFLIQLPSKATSFSVSAGKTTLTTGDSTTLTIKLVDGDGEFSVASSDSSVVSVSESKPWLEGLGREDSKIITLKALKAGTATINVTATNVSTSSFTELTGSKSVTIKVEDPPQQVDSSGAKLKSITVAGKTYPNPGTDFTVTVGANVNSTDISAVANDAGAKISGTGAKELVTGTNTVVLTVTAPNGATKNYTIRIRKLADTSTTPNAVDNQNNNNSEEPDNEEPTSEIEDLRLTYLRIEDVELIPEFNSEIFEYKVSVTNIDKLEIIAVKNIEEAELTITGNSDFVEGENEVLITITKEGQEDVVYKIIVTKTVQDIAPPVEENGTGGFLSTTGGKVAVSVGGAGAVGILGYIIYRIKSGSDVVSGARRASLRRSTFNDFDD